MKWFFCLPLLLFATSTEVESGSALFDGNDLVLQQGVYLKHPLGTMWAEKAHLIDYETRRETPFATVDLFDNVRLHFTEGAKLLCDHARIDMEKEKGLVESAERVTFTDQVDKKPMTFYSKTIAFSAKDERVETINAIDEVEALFLDGYRLTCADATYYLTPKPHVVALPEKFDVCKVERDDDLVEGESITIDLVEKEIGVKKASGKLRSPKSSLRFGAEDLVWDNTNDTLRLKGNVWVFSLQGNLNCENQVVMQQASRFGKREVTRIWAEGRTLLTTGEQTLVSKEALHIDRDHLTAQALGAQLTTGQSIIIADSAFVTYSESLEGTSVDTVRFSGNVYLRTKDPDLPLKRALCDVLDYHPKTQQMRLSSAHSHNVLYWDEKEKTRISANEILIDWPKVEGVGQVHFAFTEEEEARWFSKRKI